MSEEIFITKLEIQKVRHLEKLEILVGEEERKHLILTGANGSGKTSVLESLGTQVVSERGLIGLSEVSNLPTRGTVNYTLSRRFRSDIIEPIVKMTPFLTHFFQADRSTKFQSVSSPKMIEFNGDDRSSQFLQFLVNLRFDLLNAKEDKEPAVVMEIENWFMRFQSLLGDLYGDSALDLRFDRENYNFVIYTSGRLPFGFNQLSKGYNAVINILSELILRSPNPRKSIYDTQGIVLIDEIETHLHIELQKRILAFLTKLFPRIQFIVTTHSPFVLTSIDNAVVFDLEKQERVEDLWVYSSEALVEDYFDSDKYSELLKARVVEYEKLLETLVPTDEERERLKVLQEMFEKVPRRVAPELFAKIQQLQLGLLTQ